MEDSDYVRTLPQPSSRALSFQRSPASVKQGALPPVLKCVSGKRRMFTSELLQGIWKQQLVDSKKVPRPTIQYTAIECTNLKIGNQRGSLYLVYNAFSLLPASTKFAKKKTCTRSDMGTKWKLVIVQHANLDRLVFFILDTDGTFNFHNPVTITSSSSPKNKDALWIPINLYIHKDAPKNYLTGCDGDGDGQTYEYPIQQLATIEHEFLNGSIDGPSYIKYKIRSEISHPAPGPNVKVNKKKKNRRGSRGMGGKVKREKNNKK